LAECHLAAREVGSAQLLLKEALEVFTELGDLRREASVRYLQGRAAMDAGDVEGAIGNYALGLERFRALRYAAARERILHELRAWKRRPGARSSVSELVDRLVDAEPEKRYVGRFIRSYLGLLQLVSVIALPLAMLLMAVASPITSLTQNQNGVISLGIFFDPLRVLGVAATLVLIYLAVYAAIATLVIFWLPISRIEREQPDVIVTTPEQIARYDSKGSLAMAQPWQSVRRWLAFDRCIWDQPLALYSRTYLEDETGRDLPIDGITGWYGELQHDIGRHLADAKQPLPRENLGYSLLKSPWGVAFGLGLLLLITVTSSNNNWLDFGGLFPPPVAAALWFLGLSGTLMLVPIAYWIAVRPLRVQRTLLLNERWPIVLAVLGAFPAAGYLLTGGNLIRVTALNLALFIWGVYIVSEALMAIVAPRNRPLRLGVVAATTLLALILVAQPALAHYNWLQSYVARQQVQGGAMAAASSCAAAAQARALGSNPFETYLIQGDCAAELSSWEQAAGYYLQAAEAAPPGSGERALALYNLALMADYLGNQQLADQATGAYRDICSSSPPARPICRQLFSEGGPAIQSDDD
jgi:tetratricopeptide (TPR) repeat protein